MYESDFKAILNNNKILQKHSDLLRKLGYEDRTMCVGYARNGDFYIKECCDEWFSHVLTKEECLELSEMFKEIADELSE